MKTSEGVLILCVLATVTLSAESVNQQLNSINDLKEVDFGGSVPKHSLLLLYWFANNIDIDDNVITLNFNPNIDFGSHHYGNYEGLLEPGYRYYTIGNLNDEFPEYVCYPPDGQYEGGNLDRIIVRAEREYLRVYRIDRVYLTQHLQGTTQYDPDYTYQISTNLLQQIRRFSTGTSASLWTLRQQFHSNINDNQLAGFRQTWGNQLVCLGFFLFIIIQERFSRPKPNPGYRTQAGYWPQLQEVYRPQGQAGHWRQAQTGYRPQGQAGYWHKGQARPEQVYYPNDSPHTGNNDIGDYPSGECVLLIVFVIIVLISLLWLNVR